MGSILGFLCMLSVLISTGYPLSCIKCVNIKGGSCTGSSVTCASDQVCMSSYGESSIEGIKVSEVFLRDCAPTSYCDFEGSITVESNLKTKMGISCCSTDHCTTPMPKLPTDKTEPNGLSCRVCLTTDSDWCTSSKTIDCTGDENMCILQSSKIIGPQNVTTAFRGCTTKNVCQFSSSTQSFDSLTMESTIQCTATKYW
ncbi:phospholipase A2 inhibitor and Ly6/PLAUR domain-containing protein-like isoform X1 [Pelobates fuscus]|uniref:phospholipase A2 inhibitor and Ly6/PLAUR domain-containing protein-like isoform X1 n=1 Tax=Pelobates fuscus TaxID=191477 RepID=UPI002FE479D3